MTDSKHSKKSLYREKLIEHLFVSELLKHDWLTGDAKLEIARAEIDNAGHDIIAEKDNIIRHIQIKSSLITGRVYSHNINIGLANKPAGCVVWILFEECNDSFELKYYKFFGNSKPLSQVNGKYGYTSMPMNDIINNTDKHPIAQSTKRNKDGERTKREALREVNKSHFSDPLSFNELYERLFPQHK